MRRNSRRTTAAWRSSAHSALIFSCRIRRHASPSSMSSSTIRRCACSNSAVEPRRSPPRSASMRASSSLHRQAAWWSRSISTETSPFSSSYSGSSSSPDESRCAWPMAMPSDTPVPLSEKIIPPLRNGSRQVRAKRSALGPRRAPRIRWSTRCQAERPASVRP